MLNVNPIPKVQCPYCRKPMNRVGSPDAEAKPFPGAIVMCAECNGLSVMNDDLSLRTITAEELAVLMCDDDAMRDLGRFADMAYWRKKMLAASKNN